MEFQDKGSRAATPVPSCKDQGMSQRRTKPDTDSFSKTISSRPYGGVGYKKHGPKYD